MNTIKVYSGINSNNKNVRYALDDTTWYKSIMHSWGWGFWEESEDQNAPYAKLKNLQTYDISNINLHQAKY